MFLGLLLDFIVQLLGFVFKRFSSNQPACQRVKQPDYQKYEFDRGAQGRSFRVR